MRGGVEGSALVEVLSRPASVVVVGGSSDPQRTAGRPLRYLRDYGYAGRVAVVNPRHQSILGVTTVAEIGDLSAEPPDVAVVCLSAELVPSAVAQLDQIGVKVGVVIGSGFEDERSAPRRDLIDVLEAGRIRVLGPNSVGVMTPASGAHLNFSSVILDKPPRTGSVGLVTQSGALGNGILLSLLSRGAGIATWFSTGDEISVGALELIAGILPRPDVRGVGVFLEGLTDLDWLPRVRQAIAESGKQVFVVNSASTDVGRLAASGHTGRVVGNSEVSREILVEAGMVEVPDLPGLADTLLALDVMEARADRRRVFVVSVSGAAAVLSADRVESSKHLVMAIADGLGGRTLKARLDPRIQLGNPLDIPFLNETDVFSAAIIAAGEAGLCDSVLAIESSLAHDRVSLVEALIAAKPSAQVVLTHLSEDEVFGPQIVEDLARAGIPVMPTPDRAISALDRLCRDGNSRPASTSTPLPTRAGKTLGLRGSSALLEGFPLAPWRVVADSEEARGAADGFGYPVVVKAAGDKILHRSEVGAVLTGIERGQVAAAFAKVAAVTRSSGDAVVVQKQVAPGFEVMVSGFVDPEAGPVAFLSAGGILAELLNEHVVVWSGWTAEVRRNRVTASKLGAILAGYRGGPIYDVGGLVELIDAALDLIERRQVAFVEFNPVILSGGGATIVDVLMVLEDR